MAQLLDISKLYEQPPDIVLESIQVLDMAHDLLRIIQDQRIHKAYSSREAGTLFVP
jgi:hypothetical protein